MKNCKNCGKELETPNFCRWCWNKTYYQKNKKKYNENCKKWKLKRLLKRWEKKFREKIEFNYIGKTITADGLVMGKTKIIKRARTYTKMMIVYEDWSKIEQKRYPVYKIQIIDIKNHEEIWCIVNKRKTAIGLLAEFYRRQFSTLKKFAGEENV